LISIALSFLRGADPGALAVLVQKGLDLADKIGEVQQFAGDAKVFRV